MLRAPTVFLFNSGVSANSGSFACIPQKGDAPLYDTAIRASVHDRARASRFPRPFAQNDVRGPGVPGRICSAQGREQRVAVRLEGVYSMGRKVAPFCA